MEWQSDEVAAGAVETPVRKFDTTFPHEIDLAEAREMIGRYKRANPGSRSASMFTRVPLDAILAQKGCMGMRMYFAMNPDGTTTLVLVGVDEHGNDLDEGRIAELSYPCPPWCAMDSALDS